MVTKTVICVTKSEAAALAATESWSSAEAKSIINNAPTKEILNTNEEVVLAPLSCNRPSSTTRAQHPSFANYSGRGGGKKRAHPSCAPNANASTSYYYNSHNNFTNTRMFPLVPPSNHHHQWPRSQNYPQYYFPYYFPPMSYSQHFQPSIYHNQQQQMNQQLNSSNDRITTNNNNLTHHHKRQKVDADATDTFILNRSNVPPSQPPPIPNSKGGRIDNNKNGSSSSKYTGVYCDKLRNNKKWQAARISIHGKEQRRIGLYEDEEEAAVDYARAVFKYKDQGDLEKQKSNVIDLSDVPPQPPIPKSKGRMKEGSSKYTGISFLKKRNKWEARIELDGKFRCVGLYENEEEAAIDYARAVFKYKRQKRK